MKTVLVLAIFALTASAVLGQTVNQTPVLAGQQVVVFLPNQPVAPMAPVANTSGSPSIFPGSLLNSTNRLALGLLGLLLLGALLWAFMRNRRHPQGDGQVDGNFLVVRHPLEVTADPIRLHATVNVAGGVPAPAPVPPPAPAPPVPAPAPVPPAPPAPAPAPPVTRMPKGTPCPRCAVPKPTLAARFCAACGQALPVILAGLLLSWLLLFGEVKATAQTVITAQPCIVNGRAGQCFNLPEAPAPAVAPAPKPAAPALARVRRAVPPAPKPAVQQLTADDIRRAVMEGVKAAMPITPAPAPAIVSAPASAPITSGLGQQVVDRLVAVEDGQRNLTIRTNEVVDRIAKAERRVVGIMDNQEADHQTLGLVGAAAITGSRRNGCAAFKRLMAQDLLSKDSRPPKGCK